MQKPLNTPPKHLLRSLWMHALHTLVLWLTITACQSPSTNPTAPQPDTADAQTDDTPPPQDTPPEPEDLQNTPDLQDAPDEPDLPTDVAPDNDVPKPQDTSTDGISEQEDTPTPNDAAADAEPDCDTPPCDPPQPELCATDSDCGIGMRCECNGQSCGEGQCVARPLNCPTDEQIPVCGCDGQTYASDCIRQQASTCLFAQEPCEEIGTCIGDEDCDASEFCAFDDVEDPGLRCGRGGRGRCTAPAQSCPPGFDPVCGCDDQTYDNACLAAQAGVTIWLPGACPPRIRCNGPDECPEDMFCECDGQSCGYNRCLPSPAACPIEPDPVCDCQGTTHLNDCFRQVAGACQARDEPCEPTIALCRSANDCQPGQACLFEEGVCQELGAEGFCVEVPESCTDALAPVCGCDGQTYDNACLALQAGISLDAQGPCPDNPQACQSDAQCPEGSFCECARGVCSSAGQCIPLPTQCPGDIDPVCGCDGQTYDNDCLRQQGGTCVVHLGDCRAQPPDGCEDNTQCLPTEMCEFELNTCQQDDRRGVCIDRPDDCQDDILGPVCGCDGLTYPSNCQRQAQGIALAYRGTCGDPLQRCQRGDDCGPGRYCECFEACGAEGSCLPAPEQCPQVSDPVCGCDNITYDNDCLRQQAGTCLLDEAACDQSPVCAEFLDIRCRQDQVCDPPPNQCGRFDLVGRCVPLVLDCDFDLMEPVCACDGQTFTNDCLRIRAGLPKDYDGPCQP